MSYTTKQRDILAFQPDVLIIQECSEKDLKQRSDHLPLILEF